MKKLAFSILAVVCGLGIAVTQSSFKAANTTQTWGYIQSSNSFDNITGLTEDDSLHPAHGTYSCLMSANVCKGDDPNQPTQVSDLTNTKAGTFRLNP